MVASQCAARSRLVVACLVAVAAAAGCATTLDGRGATPVSVSASSSAGFPSVIPTPTPASPSTAVLPTPVPVSSTAAAPASRDITDVRFRIPRGFVKSNAYHPVSPLESRWLSRYLVPSNERRGLDVISILLYRLPGSVSVDTIPAQKARVRLYDRRIGARVQNGLHVEVVAGRPAIQENAIEQGTYRYAAWFVFSRRHLALVSCQVDQEVNKIARGCQALLNSLTFG
jgi:hypothetical protein